MRQSLSACRVRPIASPRQPKAAPRATRRATPLARAWAIPLAVSLGAGTLGAGILTMTLGTTAAIAQSEVTLLTNGDQSEAVSRLQSRLSELGFFEGEATGFYGPLTEEAVIRFQTAQGLLADGIAGSETLNALLPAPTATAAPSENLGLDGEQLRNLQTKLARLGFYLGEVDGLYGPQSEAAINSFQSVYALPVTGGLDRDTLATLDRVYNQTVGTIAVGASTVPATSFSSIPATPLNQTQVSSQTVTLPPAIPSGPAPLASIPQTTVIASPLPPPSLPGQQPYYGNLPPLTSNQTYSQPVRQTPQVASAPTAQGYPYIVAVPVKTGATLAEVRKVAANATIAGSKRGTYIQAGAFNSREDAERATQVLRDRSLDARVIYRPQ